MSLVLVQSGRPVPRFAARGSLPGQSARPVLRFAAHASSPGQLVRPVSRDGVYRLFGAGALDLLTIAFGQEYCRA